MSSLAQMASLAKDTAETLRVKARGTDLEKRLLEALSGENWGASSSVLNQISQDTYDYEKYPVIMKAVWAAMECTVTSWRKVFKSLCLVEHLIKNGNERIVEETRDRLRFVRSLTDFSFFEGGVDRGSGVREKAKNVIDLLQDNDRIREERGKARQLREKFSSFNGNSMGGIGGGFSSGSGSGCGGCGHGIGSYSEGGIGSSAFEQRRQSDVFSGNGVDARSGRGGSARGRYSDEGDVGVPVPPQPPSASSHGSSKHEKKKFDIKIKSKDTPKPSSSTVSSSSAHQPDLLSISSPEESFPTTDDFGAFKESSTQFQAPAPLIDPFSAPPPLSTSGAGSNVVVQQHTLMEQNMTLPQQAMLMPQQQLFQQQQQSFQQQQQNQQAPMMQQHYPQHHITNMPPQHNTLLPQQQAQQRMLLAQQSQQQTTQLRGSQTTTTSTLQQFDEFGDFQNAVQAGNIGAQGAPSNTGAATSSLVELGSLTLNNSASKDTANSMGTGSESQQSRSSFGGLGEFNSTASIGMKGSPAMLGQQGFMGGHISNPPSSGITPHSTAAYNSQISGFGPSMAPLQTQPGIQMGIHGHPTMGFAPGQPLYGQNQAEQMAPAAIAGSSFVNLQQQQWPSF